MCDMHFGIVNSYKQQNAASHLGLFGLLTYFSSKNEIKMKITPDAHENGLIQMIRMGKSIRHKTSGLKCSFLGFLSKFFITFKCWTALLEIT